MAPNQPLYEFTSPRGVLKCGSTPEPSKKQGPWGEESRRQVMAHLVSEHSLCAMFCFPRAKNEFCSEAPGVIVSAEEQHCY